MQHVAPGRTDDVGGQGERIVARIGKRGTRRPGNHAPGDERPGAEDVVRRRQHDGEVGGPALGDVRIAGFLRVDRGPLETLETRDPVDDADAADTREYDVVRVAAVEAG